MTAYARTIQLDQPLNAGDTLSITVKAPALVVPPPIVVVPPPVVVTARQPITVGAGQTGIVVPAGAADVVIADKAFVGPQSAVKTSGEFGIRALGTAANPIRRLTIRNCSFKSFGFGGIWLEYVNEFVIDGCEIDGIGYAGVMTISSTDGTINASTIRNIALGYYNAWQPGMEIDPALNAYGIALSAYSGPPSERIKVTKCVVDNVPGWHGIDGHSANTVTLEDNHVSRCNRAYWSAASAARPHDWILNRNIADLPTPRPDVRTTAPYNEVAYTFINTDRVSGAGNVATGWPQKVAADGSTGVMVAIA